MFRAAYLLGISDDYVTHCILLIYICVLLFLVQINKFHADRQLPFSPESTSTPDRTLTLQMCLLIPKGSWKLETDM